MVAVNTGERDALRQVVCNDNAATTVQSRVEFDAAAGTTYHVQVALWLEGGSGTLAFTLRDATSPDATPPEPPAPAIAEAEPDQYADGATLYYNPAGDGGEFTVTSATADEESGVAAVAFPEVFGNDATTDTMPSTVEEAAAAGEVAPVGAVGFAAPGAAVAAPRRGPTYEATYRWEAGSTAGGGKRVLARNGVGKTATAAFAVRPDGRGPSVAISPPRPGAVAGEGLVVRVEAADAGAGVARVQVRWCLGESCRFERGKAVGADAVAPYAVRWSPPGEGTYTLVARAVDRVGNARTAAPVVVTVGGGAEVAAG